jgi:hypothetical protein
MAASLQFAADHHSARAEFRRTAAGGGALVENALGPLLRGLAE